MFILMPSYSAKCNNRTVVTMAVKSFVNFERLVQFILHLFAFGRKASHEIGSGSAHYFRRLQDANIYELQCTLPETQRKAMY
jgi:hypothetical protein